MRNMNGVLVYDDPSESPPAPEKTRGFLKEIGLGFGWTLVQEHGEHVWYPASLEAWIESEAKRLGIERHKVVRPTEGCIQLGPMECSMYYCGNGHYCTRVFNPNSNHYYCQCV